MSVMLVFGTISLSCSAIKEAQVPRIQPRDERLAILELDRQPQVPGIDRVLGTPPIRHEDERPSLTGHWQDVRALPLESRRRILADTRIAQGLPRSPNRIGRSQTCPRSVPSPCSRR